MRPLAQLKLCCRNSLGSRDSKLALWHLNDQEEELNSPVNGFVTGESKILNYDYKITQPTESRLSYDVDKIRALAYNKQGFVR